MEAFSTILDTLVGVPAVVGLILAAVTVFLTSDWRLSLTALLLQYILVGVALASSLQLEVVLVKMLVGVLVVSILYLTARRIQEQKEPAGDEQGGHRLLGMSMSWAAGPLGLPLRLMTILLVVLAILRVFSNYHLTIVPLDVAFIAVWLGAMGMAGLVLSSDPLRVAPALLTVLCGFDLVYARLEPSLAIAGFWGTLMLLTALAFSYLTAVRGLGMSTAQISPPPAAFPFIESTNHLESSPEPVVPAEAETES